MKYSKRYIVLTILIIINFFLKFQVFELDNSEVGSFRGGTLHASAWNPLVAKDVNSKLLRVVIDNKEYTNKELPFYMDENRNIMAPVSMLTEALNCSTGVYDDSKLLVEKHNFSTFSTDFSTGLFHRMLPRNYALSVYIINYPIIRQFSHFFAQ